MNLSNALSQISEMRHRMAQAEVFRGYRALPVAVSGLLAIAAAIVQAAFIPDPAAAMSAYLWLWVGAAAASCAVVGGVMLVHCVRGREPLRKQTTWLAVERFSPCLVAGCVLTAVLLRTAPGSLELLPGLWQIMFSLGLFASAGLLPRALGYIAVFYLLSGAFCLAVARGPHAFAPWAMGVPFGAGQLLSAVGLHVTLERRDD